MISPPTKPSQMTWNDDEYVSFDFETSGTLPEYALQSWRLKTGDAWITSIAWVYRKEGQIISGGDTDPHLFTILGFLQWCIDEGRTIVGWNVQFDIQWLLALGCKAWVDQLRFVDGMLLWRHLEIEPEYETTRVSKRSYSLKTAVREHLPQYAGYEEQIDFHSADPNDRAQLHAYNIQDCLFTLRLTRKFYLMLKPRQAQAVWIEAQCLTMIARANLEGLPVDTLHAKALSQKLKDKAAILLTSLAPHGVTEKVVRSPIQMAKLLYDAWGLPVLKLNTSPITGKQTRSTDKTVLHELAFMDPRAKELREYREALNNDTKFATTPWMAVDYCNDGYMAHPQARVFGTYSGRLTYASKQGRNKDEKQIGWAIHQSKRGAEFRDIVFAPPGFTIVEFDAAGQEFKLMAIAANDLTMLQLCQPGEDPHGFMASRISRKDYRQLVVDVGLGDKGAKALRQLGKVANLCASHSSPILTDRGHVAIQNVRADDLVWDGVEFVRHDGVVFSGVLPVITHDGVTATLDHKVLCDGEWVELQEAKATNRRIQSARGATVRIMDGIIRRAYNETRRGLRTYSVRVWDTAANTGIKFAKGQVYCMSGLRQPTTPRPCGASYQSRGTRPDASTARDELVFPLLEPQRWIVEKLRRAWDQVQVLIGCGRRIMGEGKFTSSDLRGIRHRQDQQRWSLRTGQSPTGHAQRELIEQAWLKQNFVEGGIDPNAGLGGKSLFVDLYDALCGARAFWRSYPAPRPRSRKRETQGVAQDRSEAPVYDIVNCGPRTRFAVNGRIVHNSLQYRTSAKKLRVVARVDHEIPMTEAEAYAIHQVYRDTYHRVPDYWDRQIITVSARGYAETFAGRRVQVKGDWNGKNAWSMGSTAINYRIQGTGADQKYLAMMMIRDYLTTIGARFLFDLHDGIYLLVPDRYAKSAAKHIQHELNNLPYGQCWNFMPPIPLNWDAKIGKSWGSLKDFKP